MIKPETTRQQHTPKERAQKALGVADRAVNRLTDKAALLRADLAEVEHELMLAKRRQAYLAQSPDLDDPAQTTIDDALDGETLPEATKATA